MLFSLFPNQQRKLEIQAREQQIENESFAAHAKKIIGSVQINLVHKITEAGDRKKGLQNQILKGL